jgi:hypothetical protein
VGAITGRAAPQVMRLALIFALLDCTKDIRLPHLQAALEIWRYCSASASYIFGESIGDETADEIRRFLITVGSAGATRTDISTFFGKNKPSAEISRALSVLAQHGQARFETEPPKEGTDGRGRRGERWFACDK